MIYVNKEKFYGSIIKEQWEILIRGSFEKEKLDKYDNSIQKLQLLLKLDDHFISFVVGKFKRFTIFFFIPFISKQLQFLLIILFVFFQKIVIRFDIHYIQVENLTEIGSKIIDNTYNIFEKPSKKYVRFPSMVLLF